MTIPSQPFALHGAEKMIYDVRMGPLAVARGDSLYVAYHANPDGPENHPHVLKRDGATGRWSEPVRIGTVPRFDHHFAPVIWFDHEGRLHALHGCHGRPGTHVMAGKPDFIEGWTDAAQIAPSISYPHVLPMAGGRLLLYYRAFGHLGYWCYRTSDNGGMSWSPARTLVDFDRDPEDPLDCWTGSYHSVVRGRDGRSLHIAFIYLDELKHLNPLYNRRFTSRSTLNRYHLYYLKLDLESGGLSTIDGRPMEPIVNRARAEACKVWNGGWRLTNMPSIHVDDRDQPSFLLPISGKSPWECEFTFVRRAGDRWERIPVAPTNSTWCGGLLRGGADGVLRAYVTAGKEYGELLDYGGGDLEEWTSSNGGTAWTYAQTIAPEPGLFYNNPRFVESDNGEYLDDSLLFFGWQGPGSLKAAASRRAPGRGKAFLWHRSE